MSPDASTREYFRITWRQSTAIACVYPESFEPDEQNYLDVTRLFLRNGLPVAEIYEFSGESGIIIQEDLGDKVVQAFLDNADDLGRDRMIDEAIGIIAKIQNATGSAFESGSIASKLRFDLEKLLFELDYFETHYFQSLRGRPLAPQIEKNLRQEFTELSLELEKRAAVLCHRDFHAANLMLDQNRRLRIIDHQDARIGPAAYDLVSLLLDRVLQVPSEDWLRERKNVFHAERKKLGLEPIGQEGFDLEFDLTAVQRCLKAIGTFSYQTAVRGKAGYDQYIEPMFRVVSNACGRLDRFPVLQNAVDAELRMN